MGTTFNKFLGDGTAAPVSVAAPQAGGTVLPTDSEKVQEAVRLLCDVDEKNLPKPFADALEALKKNSVSAHIHEKERSFTAPFDTYQDMREKKIEGIAASLKAQGYSTQHIKEQTQNVKLDSGEVTALVSRDDFPAQLVPGGDKAAFIATINNKDQSLAADALLTQFDGVMTNSKNLKAYKARATEAAHGELPQPLGRGASQVDDACHYFGH